MKSAEIVVIGTGSIARGIIYGLSHVPGISLRVAIIGRSRTKAGEIALLSNARAAIVGTSVTCEPFVIFQFKAAAFSKLFLSLKPKVILLAASIQSPWEISQRENAWTRLVAQGRFGITLPLQLKLAAEVSQAASDLETAVVNARYPDAVNVVLDRVGLRMTCGLGNAASIEAFCRSKVATGKLGSKKKDVRVVAHHGQVHPWLQGKASTRQPWIWLQDQEVPARQLHPNLGAIGEELNRVTTSTAIPLLLSLLAESNLHTSIPRRCRPSRRLSISFEAKKIIVAAAVRGLSVRSYRAQQKR